MGSLTKWAARLKRSACTNRSRIASRCARGSRPDRLLHHDGDSKLQDGAKKTLEDRLGASLPNDICARFATIACRLPQSYGYTSAGGR